MKPAHLVLLIVMNFFWAGTYGSFKALAPYLDAGGVTTLRFGLAAVIALLAWRWLPGKAPRGWDLGKNILMGVIVFVMAPRLQVAGVQLGKVGDSAVLVGLEPLITSVAAAIFLREHIGPRRWVGFLLGLSGVVFMAQVWRPNFRLPGLTANAIFVTAFFCEAAYSIIGKPLIARAGMIKVLAVALIAGTCVNVALDGGRTLALLPTLPPYAWGLILYLSILCTLVGYAVWFVVINETEVSVTALTVFLQPIVGLFLAVVWLGESLHVGQLWGSLAIVAGLVVGLSRQIKPAQKISDS